MTKSDKLFQRLIDNPRKPLAFRDFERLLEMFGFSLVRQRGSHRAFKHPAIATLLIVQPRGADAKPYQQQQFLDMIEANGLELRQR